MTDEVLRLEELDTQAAVFAYGLEFGIVDVSEVIKWADRLILVQSNPSDQLIDLALSGSLSAHEVASKIPGFGNGSPQEPIFTRIIEIIVEKLRKYRLHPSTLAFAFEELATRHMIEEMIPENALLTHDWAYEMSDRLRRTDSNQLPKIMQSIVEQLNAWLEHTRLASP